MRWILALVMAVGVALGMTRTSQAQVAVGVSPWGGYGVSVGNPYGYYSSGYYGLGGIGVAPTTTVYSSGYYGMAPVGVGYSSFAYPTAYSYGYYPAYGMGYRYRGIGPWRRGLFGGYRYGGFW